MVTCLPEITIVEQVDDIDFAVMATDGVWDRMTNQQVVDYVTKAMDTEETLDTVCENLVAK